MGVLPTIPLATMVESLKTSVARWNMTPFNWGFLVGAITIALLDVWFGCK